MFCPSSLHLVYSSWAIRVSISSSLPFITNDLTCSNNNNTWQYQVRKGYLNSYWITILWTFAWKFQKILTTLLPRDNHQGYNIIALRIIWWMPTYLWDTINQGKRGCPILPRMYGLTPSCPCSIASSFPCNCKWMNDTKKISTKFKHHSSSQKHQKKHLETFCNNQLLLAFGCCNL
jgi:hypothetical protein